MANICSIGLHMEFRYKKDLKAFRQAFQKKIDAAEKRNEGVKIALSKCLFDVYICDEGDKDLFVHGSVRWCLDKNEIEKWHQWLKKMKVVEYTCCYEETGCCVYGEFSFDGTELWNKYIPDSHKVWHESNTGCDSYFDDMDIALEQDGVIELVA
jgi:hypothetical protein